jgi:type I restriction enzyme M protein
VKSYNKTKPIRIEEFDAEKAWWGSEADGFAARVENERAWKVGIDAIKAAGYNLDQKNPHAAETESHDPEHLLADYARLQGEAQALRDELKQILAKSRLPSVEWSHVAIKFRPVGHRPRRRGASA